MNQTRRNQIVELLEKQGSATNAEIMEKFGVSIETVRRDLSYLEKRGLLERVYGGAVKNKYMRVEPNYVNRESENHIEKRLIAKACEPLIGENECVFFDLGTTVLAIAQILRADKKIHAFTNSLRTAIALSENDVSVTVTGGQLRGGEFSVSGGISEENMRRFNIDVALIGAAGVTESRITDFIPQEAALRKQVIENAQKVIVVADHTKFGVRAMCNVCDVDEIDVLITDEKVPIEILKKIEKAGVKIIIAK